MIELTGKYNTAKIFTDQIDQNGISQIIFLLNQPFTQKSKIRMMPDVHAGIGCVIGTTMTIQDKICPNLVGVDIGCGMEVVEIDQDLDGINLAKLDHAIHEHVPAGAEVNKTTHPSTPLTKIPEMAYRELNLEYAGRYLGTLGGGNHFIELDKSETGKVYLVIHSGSRAIGRKTAEYYQKQAYDQMRDADRNALQDYARELREAGHKQDIPELLNARRNAPRPEIDKNIAYLTGYLFDNYLHDMEIVQAYAEMNRKAIAWRIMKHMGWNCISRFSTIHNYIDVENMILRKGAVSAKACERFIIPLNMRDGALICTGKGNPDWNESAPHGAGRVLSRREAKESIAMSEYREAMKNVYSTSVGPETLDESPMAYKDAAGIIENIAPTADIVEHLTPVYNFKAGRLH